ncbi:energy transducer TonB [Vreelandella salicampi]|uniref:Protein TonB n=1 Tax=Vreelandella salicampi TaxID=1449798 RepID=A0A7Z0RVP2_9GAMM|nr:energy transducer TonB [Halomonas salicampi]NYS61405.1 TonB family protein [Halomonas salicampi]
MIRSGLSLLSGMFLALGLLWLLALLVAPPEAKPELMQEMTMTLVEPPAPAAQAPATQPEAPVAETPPPPAPSLSPIAESQIAMPALEVPDTPEPPVELNSRLPELDVAPEPTPEPEPTPKPAPEEAPREQVSEESASASQDVGQGEASSQEVAAETTSNEPVSVGQVSPANRVNPIYPSRAQRRGLEGFVEVRFIIRRDGGVKASSIEVTRAQPRRVFDRAAREAIAQWQFEPNGQRRRATQRIEFKLR